jgi:DNA-directed RNA polymerase subunit RPC12/RpoP
MEWGEISYSSAISQTEVVMDNYVCVICGGKGKERYSTGEFRDVECSDCGKYLISLTVLDDMRKRERRFNIPATRACINGFIAAGLPAVISKAEIAYHQLFST